MTITTPNIDRVTSSRSCASSVTRNIYGSSFMRSGTWTKEEEDYATLLIAEFKAGHLPLNDGSSLRGFLAQALNCRPKRVSKKLGNEPNYNGKELYKRQRQELSIEETQQRQLELRDKERRFLTRISESLLPPNAAVPSRPSEMLPDSLSAARGLSSLDVLRSPFQTHSSSTRFGGSSSAGQLGRLPIDSLLPPTQGSVSRELNARYHELLRNSFHRTTQPTSTSSSNVLRVPALSQQDSTMPLRIQEARDMLHRELASSSISQLPHQGLSFLNYPTAAQSTAQRSTTMMASLLGHPQVVGNNFLPQAEGQLSGAGGSSTLQLLGADFHLSLADAIGLPNDVDILNFLTSGQRNALTTTTTGAANPGPAAAASVEGPDFKRRRYF